MDKESEEQYNREVDWLIDEKEELRRAFEYYIEMLSRVRGREVRLEDMGRELNE